MFKKFTKISGSEVGQKPTPPKMTNEELENIEFRCAVMKLMDNFLAIRSYGNARPELVVPTKIVGKEMFVEALNDLLSQKSNKNVVKVLESLKLTNNDWKSIEDKINNINTSPINVREENNILTIIEKHGSDEENLRFFLEGYVQRIDTKEEAYQKYTFVDNMNKRYGNPLLSIISEKYLERYESFKD